MDGQMKILIHMMMSTLIFTGAVFTQEKKTNMDAPIYSYTMKTLEGKEKSLGDFKGKVLMVVNTASFCGYTPQYKDLEALYKRFNARGFIVIGFPANNFGKQEPGKDGDIAAFCERNYGVTFPMFSKISVKGDDIHPLYKYLTTETPFKEEIEWNFTKFLVDRNGNVVAKFASKVKPTEKEVVGKLEELLGSK
jgi:glutathione peroxidase